jgi:hypothetical protein
MAKQEFINNLRAARSLFDHTHAPAVASAADTQAVDDSAARAAVWLRPQSVKGFDVSDFPELDDRQKAELQAAVDEFLQVAKQVRPETIVAPEQVAAAAPPFETILSILRRYLARSPDESSIEEALKNVLFPPWVVNWDFELFRDDDDEPAIFLYLFIAPGDSPSMEMIRSMHEVRKSVRDALSAIRNERYPYLRVQKAVEYAKA